MIDQESFDEMQLNLQTTTELVSYLLRRVEILEESNENKKIIPESDIDQDSTYLYA